MVDEPNVIVSMVLPEVRPLVVHRSASDEPAVEYGGSPLDSTRRRNHTVAGDLEYAPVGNVAHENSGRGGATRMHRSPGSCRIDHRRRKLDKARAIGTDGTEIGDSAAALDDRCGIASGYDRTRIDEAAPRRHADDGIAGRLDFTGIDNEAADTHHDRAFGGRRDHVFVGDVVAVGQTSKTS